ncbi:hypothetical protein ACFL1H_03415 [Nanoarchaeota archaeon]
MKKTRYLWLLGATTLAVIVADDPADSIMEQSRLVKDPSLINTEYIHKKLAEVNPNITYSPMGLNDFIEKEEFVLALKYAVDNNIEDKVDVLFGKAFDQSINNNELHISHYILSQYGSNLNNQEEFYIDLLNKSIESDKFDITSKIVESDKIENVNKLINNNYERSFNSQDYDKALKLSSLFELQNKKVVNAAEKVFEQSISGRNFRRGFDIGRKYHLSDDFVNRIVDQAYRNFSERNQVRSAERLMNVFNSY